MQVYEAIFRIQVSSPAARLVEGTESVPGGGIPKIGLQGRCGYVPKCLCWETIAGIYSSLKRILRWCHSEANKSKGRPAKWPTAAGELVSTASYGLLSFADDCAWLPLLS
jgi:hypothetical protein